MSSALAQAPPADATRLLYERHSSRIFGFCLSRLGSREEAEDAVQTTFMNAQRGLDRGVVPEYELAWLFKIAQNVCHNRHQSARRRGRLEAVQDLDALQDVIASPDRSVSVSLGELTGALAAIPKRQRQALLLREFQGLSYDEIAEELDISVAAVETLLFRARRSVAQRVDRRGAFASVFEAVRWLFSGGDAPLKIAAVTAAVATTATVATVPVVRDHASAPVAPKVSTPHAVVLPTRPATTKPSRQVVRTAGNSRAATSQATTSALTTTEMSPTHVAPPSPPPKTSSSSASAPPQPPVQQVAVPTLLEVTVPDLPLPEVTVPPVQVPEVEAPQLPDVQLPQLP